MVIQNALSRISKRFKANERLQFCCPFMVGLSIVITGCGSSSDLPELVSVQGSVSYNGGPLSTGEVRYVPEDENSGRLATGTIQSDGKFVMKSYSEHEGVVAGKYRVVIVSEKDDPNAPKREEGLAAPIGKISAIPVAYTLFDTTKLTETINPGDSGKNVTYELKD